MLAVIAMLPVVAGLRASHAVKMSLAAAIVIVAATKSSRGSMAKAGARIVTHGKARP